MIKNITVAIKEPANSKIIAISFISKKRNRHIARKQKMIFINHLKKMSKKEIS